MSPRRRLVAVTPGAKIGGRWFIYASLTISGDGLVVTNDVGRSKECIQPSGREATPTPSDVMRCCLDANWLLDVLGAIESEHVVLSRHTRESPQPVRIAPPDEDGIDVHLLCAANVGPA